MWFLVAAGVVILLGLIVGAPLAQASNHPFFAFSIYEAFSHLCHQAPGRSFFIASQPFAVCARCTGVYAGFAAATLMYPLLISLRRINTPERIWLLIAAAPLAIDFALGFLGIWENTHFSRFSTGALLGAALVFYILPGLVELSLRWRSYISRTAPAKMSQTAYPGATGEQIAAAPSDYSAPLRRI